MCSLWGATERSERRPPLGVAAGEDTRAPLSGPRFFADEGAEVFVEFFLVGGDVVDAAEVISSAIEEVGAFVAFAHDLGDLMFAAANAGAGHVIVVFDFNPIFDGAAFSKERAKIANFPFVPAADAL